MKAQLFIIRPPEKRINRLAASEIVPHGARCLRAAASRMRIDRPARPSHPPTSKWKNKARPAHIANPKPPNRPPPDPHRRRRRHEAYRLVPPSAWLAAGRRRRPAPRLPSRYGESLSYQTNPAHDRCSQVLLRVCLRVVLCVAVGCVEPGNF